jgi:two-component system response regulator MprA
LRHRFCKKQQWQSRCTTAKAQERDVTRSILIVDDEPGITEALALVLQDEGYDVRVASDGAQAVALLEKRRVDLILTDVMMPTIDGLRLLRHIRRHGDRTPVILMSAAAQPASHPPDVPLVVKPFDLDAILGLIEQKLFDAGSDRLPGRAAAGELDAGQQAPMM